MKADHSKKVMHHLEKAKKHHDKAMEFAEKMKHEKKENTPVRKARKVRKNVKS